VYVILKICIVHCVLACDCDFFPDPSVVVEARKTVSAERVYCLNTPNVRCYKNSDCSKFKDFPICLGNDNVDGPCCNRAPS
jgi:hypothetical protein